MDGSVLHIAVTTYVALKVFTPAGKDGSIVIGEVLSIRTAEGSVNLISGPIHCP